MDGLRGIAALVVVLHHCLLTSAILAGAYIGPRAPDHGLAYAVTYSPLHLFWDGTEAVTVFFVLSGFVLVLPFDGSRRPSWIGYYPRRLVRLLLPIWGGVAVAVTLALLVTRHGGFGSIWMNAHAHQVGVAHQLRDLSVVGGVSNLNSPLWSMQWEVWFSLLLPAFVLVGCAFRRAWVLKVVAACLASMVGSMLLATGHQATGDYVLKYLPVFCLGACLASVRGRIVEVLGRLNRVPAILLAVLALLMINAGWTTQSVVASQGRLAIAYAVSLLGATLLVALFVGSPAVGSVGRARWAQWLGKVSFSLYLIHEPIVVSVKNLLPGLGASGVLVISVAVSLPVAWVFFKLVEAPAFRLAQRVGGAAQHRLISTHADDRVRRPLPHHPAPAAAPLGS